MNEKTGEFFRDTTKRETLLRKTFHNKAVVRNNVCPCQ